MKKLPRGYFEFEDSEGKVIKGRVCTWSLNRFCEKMDIPNVTEMFKAITTGVSITAIAEMLLCAVEYMNKEGCPYTRDNAMDWIDDLGGLDKTISLIEESMTVKEEGAEKKSDQRIA